MAEQNSERRLRKDDARLYVPEHNGWKAMIKQDSGKEYCFSQNPGEDFYHLLIGGEIYLQRDTEKVCLNCALRHGYATRDRTSWQRSPGSIALVIDEAEGNGIPIPIDQPPT